MKKKLELVFTLVFLCSFMIAPLETLLADESKDSISRNVMSEYSLEEIVELAKYILE